MFLERYRIELELLKFGFRSRYNRAGAEVLSSIGGVVIVDSRGLD